MLVNGIDEYNLGKKLWPQEQDRQKIIKSQNAANHLCDNSEIIKDI